MDSNNDGLYDSLVVRVGVIITATDTFTLTGSLADSSGENFVMASVARSLTPGSYLLDLTFPGTSIRSHGVDGPYVLTNLTLVPTLTPARTAASTNAYNTSDYRATQFYGRIGWNPIADIWVAPNGMMLPALNLRNYAWHESQNPAQLTYSVTSQTNKKAGVSLGGDGSIFIVPQQYWLGDAEITVRVSSGSDYADETFRVNVGWRQQTYVPTTQKSGSEWQSASQVDNWAYAIRDNFEDAFYWRRWSVQHGIPGEPFPPTRFWQASTCRAYSGQKSAWVLGGSFDTPAQCGEEYNNGYETTMFWGPTITLKYVGQAELRAKVWMNMAPGDEICALATTEAEPPGDFPQWSAWNFYGTCISGNSQTWQDLALDLANVPVLGNILGNENVHVAFRFRTNDSGRLPEGAFIDDVELRVCPEMLSCR